EGAGFLRRDRHALTKIVASLDEKDDGLDRLALAEEEAALAIRPVPVREQLRRHARRTRIAGLSPGLHALPDFVDERQHDARADVIGFGPSSRAAGRPVVIARLAAFRNFLGRLPLLDQPVLRRLRVGVADDRLEDFVQLAHALPLRLGLAQSLDHHQLLPSVIADLPGTLPSLTVRHGL